MYTDHVPQWKYLYTDLLTPHGIHILFWMIVVFSYFFSNFVFKVVYYVFPKMDLSVNIEENVDNFFKSLDDEDRDWSIKEHQNAKEQLGIEIFDDDMINKL